MYLPDVSYASFPVESDTTQIQKETLEEYKLRIQKQGFQTQTVFAKEEGVLEYKNSDVIKKSKFKKYWNSRNIHQKVLLIIFGLLLLFVALLLVVIANLEISFDGYDFNLDGL
tara:strand:+ start:101 stop:439 length:339 start_codon:yes stop_codon:yes gene_type:complete